MKKERKERKSKERYTKKERNIEVHKQNKKIQEGTKKENKTTEYRMDTKSKKNNQES